MANLLKSSTIVSFWTFLSRILGLVRDIVLANLLGATYAADVFLVAQKIPNFLRRLFAEGAFATAFVPVFSEYEEQRSRDRVLQFLGRVSGTLGIILLVVTAMGVLGSSGLVAIFGAGFIDEPQKFNLASTLLKITFPYILFISLTAFSGSILNTIGRFAVPAFTPLLLNISLITAAVFVAPYLDEPTLALAWGIFIAGVLQLVVQLPFLWKAGYLVKPSWGWRSEGVQRILKLMAPVIFGASVSQINLLIDTQIASFLPTGSISWLYFSDRLMEFPLGIFGIAIATVLLPSLSRMHAKKDVQDFSHSLNWGLKVVLMLSLPAMLGLALLAEPLMITIFQHGNYTPVDSTMAARSLVAYSLGMVGFMLVKILVAGFYARQNTKTPVKIGIWAMLTNIVLNLALFSWLAHVGLAVATSVAALLNALLLYLWLRRDGVLLLDGDWGQWWLRYVVGCTVMVALLWWLHQPVAVWQAWPLFEKIGYLALTVAVGAGGYLIALVALGVRPHHILGKAAANARSRSAD